MQRRRFLAWPLMAAAAAVALVPVAAASQGVDLVSLDLQRQDGG